MTFTGYYRCEELKKLKSHRYDCVASTGNYSPFEALADRSHAKRLHFYYNGVPDTFNRYARRNAERAITNIKNISSVFIPDLNRPLIGYGDTRGTNDALIFVFAPDYSAVEVYVAPGMRYNQRQLWEAFAAGAYTREVMELKAASRPIPRPDNTQRR